MSGFGKRDCRPLADGAFEHSSRRAVDAKQTNAQKRSPAQLFHFQTTGWIVLGIFVVTVAFVTPIVYSHCQIPCGIYDDPARLAAIAENTTTVEKAMKSITEMSADPKTNMNQIVRWVNVKDLHASDTDEIITYYFMAQRIKPVDKNDAGYEKYIKQLTLLHEMLVTSMKTKQTTDLANVEKLRSLLKEFRTSYLGAGEEHSH